jgi:hypothetical protein
MIGTSIESAGIPLCFKVGHVADFPADLSTSAERPRYRTLARALEGMQKEAVVFAGPSQTAWRLVCDEGPYLNGTDLAPFPLAFYSAGLASTYAAAIAAAAKVRDVPIAALTLTQDSRYTMEGSALRGTMTGGALPVDLEVALESNAPPDVIRRVIAAAVLASPGDACARRRVTSTFAAALNGRAIGIPRVSPSQGSLRSDPEPVFARIPPAAASEYEVDIIAKLEAAQPVFGVEGGVGSSLNVEQRRTLHVRGVLVLHADGLGEITIQLFKPLGSTFRILSDVAPPRPGAGRAPCGLSLLCAGIAFCYLTQIGRYAHIVRQRLDAYRICQDMDFRKPRPGEDHAAAVELVDTHVFVTSPEPADAIARSVAMGEQTCFLHANLRGAHEARVAVRLNGRAL